ncbi:MAG TPA: protein kinase [Acidimicrobiales bacterium]|nr:protein kinase [Acidimicrobiales bacterium]
MGEAERLGPWFCGPAADRRAYVVDDVEGVEGGEGLVVRAQRRTFAGDPVGYEGIVSLKLLTGTSPQRAGALRRRWERLAAIDHPNLARPLESFTGPGLSRRPDRAAPPEASNDVCYVATVWVDGRGLREVVPLDPATTFAYVLGIAQGLSALHERDLMHRDLHPGNVVVDGSGQAVLIDFGSTRPADGPMTTTVSGVMGFIAPECLHGRESPATDRWGLGTLTVLMLLGHPQGQVREDQLRSELDNALKGIGQRRRAVDLICRMVDADPDARPEDAVDWARELQDCLARRQQRRRQVIALVAAGVLLLGAEFGLRALGDDPDGADDDTTADASAAPAPADPDPAAAPSPTPPPCDHSVAGRTPMDEAVAQLAPEACLSGEPEAVGDASFQALLSSQGDPAGVVVLPPNGEAVRLTPTMWTSFREISGPSAPDNAIRFGGYPVGVRRIGGSVIVQLSGPGILVGPREDTQLFWVPGQVMPMWMDDGGGASEIGFPMSNPYSDDRGLHQDFERGSMHAYADPAQVAEILAGGPFTSVIEPEVSSIDPTGDGAPELAGRIVRQFNGTAWWVDDDGVRHWLPDDATWRCLGGDDEPAHDGLHGWDVAVLPLGPVATCP